MVGRLRYSRRAIAGLDRPSATSPATSSSRGDSGPAAPAPAGKEAPRRRRTRSARWTPRSAPTRDRKSTRLNSSHVRTSYAVFGLKKKKSLVGGEQIEEQVGVTEAVGGEA